MFSSAELLRAQLPCSRRAFLRNAWTGSNGWHALRCSESSRTRQQRDFDGTQRRTVALRRRTMQGMNSASDMREERCRKLMTDRGAIRYDRRDRYWPVHLIVLSALCRARPPLSFLFPVGIGVHCTYARYTRRLSTNARNFSDFDKLLKHCTKNNKPVCFSVIFRYFDSTQSVFFR